MKLIKDVDAENFDKKEPFEVLAVSLDFDALFLKQKSDYYFATSRIFSSVISKSSKKEMQSAMTKGYYIPAKGKQLLFGQYFYQLNKNGTYQQIVGNILNI